MTELVATYVVSFFAMAFAATSAFALITAANHLDPPDTKPEMRKAA